MLISSPPPAPAGCAPIARGACRGARTAGLRGCGARAGCPRARGSARMATCRRGERRAGCRMLAPLAWLQVRGGAAVHQLQIAKRDSSRAAIRVSANPVPSILSKKICAGLLGAEPSLPAAAPLVKKRRRNSLVRTLHRQLQRQAKRRIYSLCPRHQ